MTRKVMSLENKIQDCAIELDDPWSIPIIEGQLKCFDCAFMTDYGCVAMYKCRPGYKLYVEK